MPLQGARSSKPFWKLSGLFCATRDVNHRRLPPAALGRTALDPTRKSQEFIAAGHCTAQGARASGKKSGLRDGAYAIIRGEATRNRYLDSRKKLSRLHLEIEG